MKEDKSRWNLQMLNDICSLESMKVITSLEWLDRSMEDKLIWMGNESGRFLVKEAFNLIISMRNS